MTPPDAISAILDCVGREGSGLRFGIGVSGGSDSRALLVLATEALGAARIEAATVDHGLRLEAGEEARGVGALCADLGVAHQVLPWRWDGQGNLQEAARLGRRKVLSDWARGRGLGAVLLAHTRDDQAETVLMALARGAGVDGLSAMPERRLADGALWLRPLLAIPRLRLREELSARGITWDEDPSNADLKFERVRMRALLAAAGIDAGALAALAQRMQSVRAALEEGRAAAQATMVTQDRGTLLIADAPLANELRLRLFQHLLLALAPGPAPRRAALERWTAQGGPLAGVVLHRDGDRWRMFREARAVAGLSASTDSIWDGRWHAEGPEPAQIRALGGAGLLRLSRQAHAGLHPHWRETGLSRAALAGLPAIWQGDTLIAAPLAGWANGWRLSAAPLPVSELSH